MDTYNLLSGPKVIAVGKFKPDAIVILVPSGSVNDGHGGANYSVTFVNNTTGTITARALTVTAAANSKTYDANTSAATAPTITAGVVQIGTPAAGSECRCCHPRAARRGL